MTGLEGLGATIAVGGFFIVGFLLSLDWLIGTEIFVGVSGGTKQNSIGTTLIILLVLSYATGILIKNTPDYVVGSDSNTLLLHSLLISPSEGELKGLVLLKNTGELNDLGTELLYAGFFSTFAGKKFPNLEKSLLSSSKVPNPDEFKEAAKLVYYKAKNEVFKHPTYFTELMDVQHRIDFIRSIEIVSVLLLIWIVVVMLIGLNTPDIASIAYRRVQMFPTETLLSRTAIMWRSSVLTLIVCCFYTTSTFGYQYEEIQFNKRIYGYFLTLAEAQAHSSNELRHALTTDAESKEPRFTLIIDAGSSGSRVYIYKIEPNRYDHLPEITLLDTEKVKPGISKFEDDPKHAKANLAKLLAKATSVFDQYEIDPQKRKDIPLYFLATAGMRLLKNEQQETILQEVRDFFSKDGTFDFRMAETIAGSYEGLYSWLAINYLDDHFDPALKREGMLEMGGASTQIAFTPSTKFEDNKVFRTLRGINYDIFAKSYLSLGQEEARKFIGTKSCVPCNGEENCRPRVQFQTCAENITTQFQAYCANDINNDICFFQDTFSPKLEGDFIAVSAFYFIFKALDEPLKLQELENQSAIFCSLKKLPPKYPGTPDPILKNYCFNSAYFWKLLGEGYDLSDSSEHIVTRQELNGVEISWTLGALLDIELGNVPKRNRDPYEK